MAERNYLQLLAETTPTQFWNDSGEPAEIRTALANGACGVTTNPILITRSVLAHADEWQARIRHMARTTAPAELPHEITAQIVCHAADMLLSTWVRTQGKAGWVCAQGNPNNFNNAGAMVDEALAFASLRPNIATKIPVSEAGLAAIEELTSSRGHDDLHHQLHGSSGCAHRRGLSARPQAVSQPAFRRQSVTLLRRHHGWASR